MLLQLVNGPWLDNINQLLMSDVNLYINTVEYASVDDSKIMGENPNFDV